MTSCFGLCFGAGRSGRKQPDAVEVPVRQVEEPKPETAVVPVDSGTPKEPKTKSRGTHNRTALHLAAESGHVGVLQTLLETLLCQALAEHEKDVDEIEEDRQGAVGKEDFLSKVLNARDSRLQTPLMVATSRGHSECVSFLLANGADRTLGDAKGNTPLHVASARGFLNIVLLLSTMHATEEQLHSYLDAANAAGFTPLHHAVWGRQSAAVQILLQHGADMMAQNTRAAGDVVTCPPGTTPLHLAACRGNMEVCRILLKSWLDRVVEPMMSQSVAGREEATLAAIAALDPRGKPNAVGHTPYQLAQRLGFFSLALFLRPSIPIARLFNSDERNIRFYGPPALKTIAAAALNKSLVANLDALLVATNATLTGPVKPVLGQKAVSSPLPTSRGIRPSTGGLNTSYESNSSLPSSRQQSQIALIGHDRPRSISLAPSPRGGSRLAASPRVVGADGVVSAGVSQPMRLDMQVLNELNGEDSEIQLNTERVDVMSVLEEHEMPQLPMTMTVPGQIGEEQSMSVVRADSWSAEDMQSNNNNPSISLTPDPGLEFLIQQQEERTSTGSTRVVVTRSSMDQTPVDVRVSVAQHPSSGQASREPSRGRQEGTREPSMDTRPGGSSLDPTQVADLQEVDSWLAAEGLPGASEAGAGAQAANNEPGGMCSTGRSVGNLPEHVCNTCAAMECVCRDAAGKDCSLMVLRGSKGVCPSPLDVTSEDDDNECGVCLEEPAIVMIAPCSHTLCGPCAKKLCTVTPLKPTPCPFCRSLISSFSLLQ